MEINFDDLKREFDALKHVKQEEACEIGCDGDAENLGFIDRVRKYMLAPARCGVYYSRLDIKIIGLRFDEDVQVRQRNRMIRDILKAVTSKEELEEVFNIIKDVGEEKVEGYKRLSKLFPSSKPIFDEKIEKFERFKKVLDSILDEIEEEELL